MATIQLLCDDPVPAGAAGAGRARHTEDYGGICQPGKCPGLDGRGADFLVGKLTKKLTKAFDINIEQGLDRCQGIVSSGKTGTPCE